MAMASQFLGFMPDAYDNTLVLIMVPILVKLFSSPGGSAAWNYIERLTLASVDLSHCQSAGYEKDSYRRIVHALVAGSAIIGGGLGAPFAETGEYFLGGFFADRAGVVEDDVGGVDGFDLLVAAGEEDSGDFLGVVLVHLAAEGFQIEGAGGAGD
jgi:MFS family permease